MNSESVLIICLAVLIVLFSGTPDLMDALIANLSKP